MELYNCHLTAVLCHHSKNMAEVNTVIMSREKASWGHSLSLLVIIPCVKKWVLSDNAFRAGQQMREFQNALHSKQSVMCNFVLISGTNPLPCLS